MHCEVWRPRWKAKKSQDFYIIALMHHHDGMYSCRTSHIYNNLHGVKVSLTVGRKRSLDGLLGWGQTLLTSFFDIMLQYPTLTFQVCTNYPPADRVYLLWRGRGWYILYVQTLGVLQNYSVSKRQHFDSLPAGMSLKNTKLLLIIKTLKQRAFPKEELDQQKKTESVLSLPMTKVIILSSPLLLEHQGE